MTSQYQVDDAPWLEEIRAWAKEQWRPSSSEPWEVTKPMVRSDDPTWSVLFFDSRDPETRTVWSFPIHIPNALPDVQIGAFVRKDASFFIEGIRLQEDEEYRLLILGE